MIVDFVFGGSDYIKKNKDALEELGPHDFKIVFNFAGKRMFFIRSTENPKEVLICNDKFISIKKPIKLDEYTALLQKEYQCQLNELSFRAYLFASHFT